MDKYFKYWYYFKKNRQGYDDFINQFRVPINQEVQQISLDGANTCRECIRAIEKLQHTDIIVIIRGGGDTNDISGAYDDIKLFDAIKQSNIPVVTAIGHQQDKGDKLIITQISDLDFPTPTALAKDLNRIFLEPLIEIIDNQISINDTGFLKLQKLQDKYYLNLESVIDSCLKLKFKGPIVNVNDTDECVIVNKGGQYYEVKLDNMKQINLPDGIISTKDNLQKSLQNREISNVVKYLNQLNIQSGDLIDLLDKKCKEIQKMDKYLAKYDDLVPKIYKKFYLNKTLTIKNVNDFLQIKSTLLYYKEVIKNDDSSAEELSDIMELTFN